MKYKPTPLNITCGILIGLSAYGAIFPGPMGFGYLLQFYLLPIAFLGLGFDYLGQRKIKSYSRLFLIEIGTLTIISFGFAWQERTKTYIISDKREFEFVVTIYDVKNSGELPVNFFTWNYEKEIPDNGILLTSNRINTDLPKTEMFTKSGLSLQDRNDTVDLCFGRASTSKIEVNGKKYEYQAWKIDKGGTIGYSSNDIKELEEKLKDYLKRKKPSS
ncbi:hypothetical protein ACFOUP_16330 [Belliella kenyensis]|uniref:Uncharacterized protein n=1 Tax=Belliella kenyensis TaxID=1472724 RepID=A0ABV8ENQ1_9BACT|nr:hypothetical protein [Belliella kenyensis]MCH7403850.1 hypothetical protein [Belliella kenyensis]MDN3603017.1 hypothetical protein [Belliella kenyensis]